MWIPGSASSSLSWRHTCRIVTFGGGHQAPNLGRRRFIVQKSPKCRAELLLLVRECELDAACWAGFSILSDALIALEMCSAAALWMIV